MPQDGEIEAGVEEFAQYGDMNWIYQLAEGQVYRVTEVLNMSWAECYIFRKMKLHHEQFAIRLREAQKQ